MHTLFSGARAKIGALAAMTALAGGLLLTAMPAAHATNEFPPNLSATATASCTGTPHFDVHLANTGGLSSASFTITITGAGPPQTVDIHDQDVIVNGTFGVSPLTTNGEHFDLTITSLGMETVTASSDFTCEQPDPTITQGCSVDGPEVVFHLANNGPIPVPFVIALNGDTFKQDDVTQADGTIDVTYPVEEGVAFSAQVLDGRDDSVLATLDGTPDCTPAPTTTTTAAPTTTAPAAEAAAVTAAPQFTG
jgi:hypothetical protein